MAQFVLAQKQARFLTDPSGHGPVIDHRRMTSLFIFDFYPASVDICRCPGPQADSLLQVAGRLLLVRPTGSFHYSQI